MSASGDISDVWNGPSALILESEWNSYYFTGIFMETFANNSNKINRYINQAISPFSFY